MASCGAMSVRYKGINRHRQADRLGEWETRGNIRHHSGRSVFESELEPLFCIGECGQSACSGTMGE